MPIYRDFSRLSPEQRAKAEKLWLETAAPMMQFVCPKCGFLRTCKKTEEPFVYECECGREIDERLHLSRRRMSYWDSYR